MKFQFCAHQWSTVDRWRDSAGLEWCEQRCSKCGQLKRKRT